MITAAGLVQGVQREESLRSRTWKGKGKNDEGESQKVK